MPCHDSCWLSSEATVRRVLPPAWLERGAATKSPHQVCPPGAPPTAPQAWSTRDHHRDRPSQGFPHRHRCRPLRGRRRRATRRRRPSSTRTAPRVGRSVRAPPVGDRGRHRHGCAPGPAACRSGRARRRRTPQALRPGPVGNGRIDKTDPNDARSAAIVAVRNATLNTVGADSEHRVVLRLLADRYHQLTAQRTRSVCRLHALLCLLIEGGTDRSLSTGRAMELLAGVAISDPITAERVATCRQFVTELEALDQALVDIRVRTVTAVDASKTTVIDLYGVGPIGAAIISDTAAISAGSRPPGTTPATTAPPPLKRPRVPRPATGSTPEAPGSSTTPSTPQPSPRSPTITPAASTTHASWPRGKTKKQATRVLKRRISDVIYRQCLADT